MTGQETLIYIEENDELDAGILAKGFAKEDVKNRAYFNALGAQLAKKYLTSENIDVTNTYNMHSIHKILEEIDISDVMLPNIHMDVRVVFNEDYIFVPKSHFNYEILPDIYLVLSLSPDHKFMKFLGFFDPKLINKNNENEEYYFIEKEKLTSPSNLKEYIQNFNGNTAEILSESEIENSDMFMVSLLDQDIAENDKKTLLNNLLKSADLRDRFIEFENFELLAYKAEQSQEVIRPAAEGMDAGFANLDFDAISEENLLSDKTEEAISIDNESDLFDLDTLTTGAAMGGVAGAIAGGAIAGTGSLAAGAEALSAGAEIISATGDVVETAGGIISGGMDFIDGLSSNEEPEFIEPEFVEPEFVEPEFEEPQFEEEVESGDFNFTGFGDENPIETLTEDFDNENVEEIVDVIETVETEEPLEIEETNDNGNVSMDLNFDSFSMDDEPQEITIEPELEELQPIEEIAQEEESIENNISFEEHSDDLSENNEFEELSMDGMSFDGSMETSLEFDNLEPLDGTSETGTTEAEEISTEQAETPKVTINSTAETIDFDDIVPLSTNTDGAIVSSIIEETMNFDDITVKDLENAETNFNEEANIENDFGLKEIDFIEDEDMSDNADEIADLDLEAEDIGTIAAKDDEDIDIEDLKDIGIDVEELPASGEPIDGISSHELISQIDDLLYEEEATENSETQAVPMFSEDDLADDGAGEYLSSDEALPETSEQDKLEMLFSTGEVHENTNNLSELDEDMADNEESNIYKNTMQPEKGKKAIIVAAAVIAVLAATAGAGMFLKSKNGAPTDAISQNPTENELPADLSSQNLPAPDNTAPGSISPDGQPQTNPADNANIMTNAPEIGKLPSPQKETKNNTELKNPAAKSTPAAVADSYVTVNKVMWEVPDYLSYSDKMKSYLQTAGKSIKLTLSSDLLLATEYAYSNQVKVDLKLRNDGTVISAQIAKSSGSNQINNIVLQTVKDTLNVIKPAGGEVPTPDFKLGLIIYF